MMLATYGHRWESAFGRHPDGITAATWAHGLSDLPDADIASAAHACLSFGDGWPPTLPEFRALALRIPTLAQVRADLAHRDSPRDGFTLLVLKGLDGYAYRRADIDRAERMLREAYTEARAARLEGVPLPETLPELLHVPTPPKPAAPEVARKYLDEIAATLGTRDDVEPEDSAPDAIPNRVWASIPHPDAPGEEQAS
jgi:hypothetical protein